MYESSSQRNKAIWVGSLALLTVGSVLYFTMLRKPEDSSKPAKDTKPREIVQERSTKINQANDKETVKDDIPQLGDVPQAKATGTLEKEVTEIMDAIPAEPTPAKQDDIVAEVVVSMTNTTIDVDSTTLDNLDNEMTTTQQDKENEKEDDLEIVQVQVEVQKEEEEKSPLLSAAPSSSSSSDIDSSALSEQQETIKTTPAPTFDNTNNNHNNSNGAGYWQPPATTATFQHSMGWPELFPLQQQQQQQQQETDQMKHAPVTTTLDTPVEAPVAAPTTTGEKKKHTKKRMSRMEQIDQQRQNYVPTMKARCNWWPNCTNKNCKYHHPYQLCRYGDMCVYNERCMFLHPWDYEEPVRHAKQPQHTDN